MDRVMSTVDVERKEASAMVKREVKRIKSYCRWTSGTWEELGGLQWNEIQNVPSHVRMLSNYIIRVYLSVRKAGS